MDVVVAGGDIGIVDQIAELAGELLGDAKTERDVGEGLLAPGVILNGKAEPLGNVARV